jgi:hypothetical protein
MRYFLIVYFLHSLLLVKGQTFDTLTINRKDKEFFKEKDLFKPETDGVKINFSLDHYFKKSCQNAYYIVNFTLGDLVVRSYEGLVVNGKFEGHWIEKNHESEIVSTHHFSSNKFDGKQRYFDGNKLVYEISCVMNQIIEFRKYDSNGELYMVNTYSKGKLDSKQIFGLNPEFYIRKRP